MSKALNLGFGLRKLQNHKFFIQTFRFYTAEKKTPVTSFIEHKCRLPIHQQEAPDMSLASIICTIGPASRDVAKLVHMMASGMRIARLNFSHGTHEYHAETIDIVREAVQVYSQALGYNIPIAIALDTKGPEIRTGLVAGDPKGTIALQKGHKIKVTTNAEFRDKCSAEVLYVDYANITKIVKADTRIFLDDGLISLKVTNVSDNELTCEVENGGKLGSQKGANLPGTPVDLPAVSEKDKQDLRFGVENCVDMVFASFIRDAKSVHEIREVLGEKGQHIKIICKIENQQGLDNIDSIIDASDGIMMARGDLGIEIDPERVFATQKAIIAKCNRVGKVAICATQMLESMTDRPRSTRAEAGDVANAILDGADCVMLSGETAKGKYPVECVQTMSKICRYAQASIWHRREFQDLADSAYRTQGKDNDMLKALASAAAFMTLQTKIGAIVAIDCNGRIARYVSRFRPNCPIIAIMSDDQKARQSVLHRAVVPFVMTDDPTKNPSDFIKKTLDTLRCTIFLPEKANIIAIYEKKFGDPENLILTTQTIC